MNNFQSLLAFHGPGAYYTCSWNRRLTIKGTQMAISKHNSFSEPQPQPALASQGVQLRFSFALACNDEGSRTKGTGLATLPKCFAVDRDGRHWDSDPANRPVVMVNRHQTRNKGSAAPASFTFNDCTCSSMQEPHVSCNSVPVQLRAVQSISNAGVRRARQLLSGSCPWATPAPFTFNDCPVAFLKRAENGGCGCYRDRVGSPPKERDKAAHGNSRIQKSDHGCGFDSRPVQSYYFSDLVLDFDRARP